MQAGTILFKIRFENAVRAGIVGTTAIGYIGLKKAGFNTIFEKGYGADHYYKPEPAIVMPLKRKRSFGIKRRSLKRFLGPARRFKKRRIGNSTKAPLTKYGDTKTMYKARRRSRFSKRKSKFAMRVRNVMANITGLKSAIFYANASLVVPAAQQGWIPVSMSGGNLNISPYLANLLTSIDPGGQTNCTLKLHMAELEVFVMNDDAKITENGYTFNVATGVVPSHSYTKGDLVSGNVMFVKVYHWVSRFDSGNNFGGDPYTMLANFMTAEAALGAPVATKISPADNGATPYDCPQWCSAFKIVDVKEYTIQPGEVLRLLLRNTKWRFIQGSRIYDNAFLKNITEGYMIQVHGPPNYTTGELAGAEAQVKFIQRYHFKHISDDRNATGHP